LIAVAAAVRSLARYWFEEEDELFLLFVDFLLDDFLLDFLLEDFLVDFLLELLDLVDFVEECEVPLLVVEVEDFASTPAMPSPSARARATIPVASFFTEHPSRSWS
jgi:hypothetical protein